MKRLIKITIDDFAKIEQNLNDPQELALYHSANGNTYEAEIEHDGFAIVDLNDDEYIELAPGEYQLMIPDWKNAGKLGALTLETKSDPDDDTAMLYRLLRADGEQAGQAQSLPKQLVSLLAKAWFEGKKGKDASGEQ